MLGCNKHACYAKVNRVFWSSEVIYNPRSFPWTQVHHNITNPTRFCASLITTTLLLLQLVSSFFIAFIRADLRLCLKKWNDFSTDAFPASLPETWHFYFRDAFCLENPDFFCRRWENLTLDFFMDTAKYTSTVKC